MIIPNKIRLFVLAVTFSGIVLTSIEFFVAPSLGKRIQFDFPSQIPLPGWQLTESNLINNKSQDNYQYVSGKFYKYQHNQYTIDIEMRYLVHTNGSVPDLIKIYTFIEPSPNLISLNTSKIKNVGFHNLFVSQGRAYLNACINPRGGSTVTNQQFAENRRNYDLKFSRLLPWLIGKENLRDWRCLWVNMSVPLDNSSPQEAYRILEKAWIYWYQWWSNRFPKP